MMDISPSQEEALQRLVDVFLEENAKVNLSAHRTKDRVWEANVMDSLAACEWIAAHAPSIPRPLPPENPPYPRPFPHGGKGDPLQTERYVKEKVPEMLLVHAREMRKSPTPAEKALWKHLRFHQLHQHFRRQHPIGNCILDFYCHKFLLGVEVDGGIHTEREEYDTERSENLHEGYGIHILRFSNDDVFNRIDYVLHSIQEFMRSPPPVGEGPGVGGKVEEGLGMEALNILDLGTGGGFPLLPLAILFPEHHFTGLDSVRKKMDAVARMVDSLNLSNVTLITGRAEESGRDPAHRERYDVVTARAVAETAILLEYCAPFVKIGGQILLWKSMNCDEEISSASGAESKLFLKRKDTIIYDLSEPWGKRQILVYEKTRSTPKEYPRAVGLAKKNPL